MQLCLGGPPLPGNVASQAARRLATCLMAPHALLDTGRHIIEYVIDMQVPGMLAQHRWKVAAAAAAGLLACLLHTLSIHL